MNVRQLLETLQRYVKDGGDPNARIELGTMTWEGGNDETGMDIERLTDAGGIFFQKGQYGFSIVLGCDEYNVGNCPNSISPNLTRIEFK